MYTSKISSYYRKIPKRRLCQGDILRDLKFTMGDIGYSNEEDIIDLNYSVIMSQDCDIERDFLDRDAKKDSKDKFLVTILVCPAYLTSKLCSGDHIEDWEMRGGIDIEKLKKNTQFTRYHYLSPDSSLSIPELTIDFKHFFTLPRDFLYRHRKDSYVATMSELFRESLAQRFTNYLSRIGIPEIKSNSL